MSKTVDSDVAIKVLLRLDRYDRFKSESMIASGLNHPNVVPILDSNLPADARSDTPPFLVMPWYENGSLSNRLGTTPDQLLIWFRQILTAIEYLHEKRLAHRDIKPSNLLLDDEQFIRLADFGLVLDIDDEDRKTRSGEFVGSHGYRAPEFTEGKFDQPDHRPADIYSIGRTIWALAAGKHPPDKLDLTLPEFNLTSILDAEWLEIQDLVRLTTQLNSQMRPTAKELIEHIESEIPKPGAVDSESAASVGALLTKVYANDGAIAKQKTENKERESLNDEISRFRDVFWDACREDPTFREIQTATDGNDEIQIHDHDWNDGRRFSATSPSSSLNIGVVFEIIPKSPNRFTFLSYIALNENVAHAPRHPDSTIEFTLLWTDVKKKEVLGTIPRQMKHFVAALKNHAIEQADAPRKALLAKKSTLARCEGLSVSIDRELERIDSGFRSFDRARKSMLAKSESAELNKILEKTSGLVRNGMDQQIAITLLLPDLRQSLHDFQSRSAAKGRCISLCNEIESKLKNILAIFDQITESIINLREEFVTEDHGEFWGSFGTAMKMGKDYATNTAIAKIDGLRDSLPE